MPQSEGSLSRHIPRHISCHSITLKLKNVALVSKFPFSLPTFCATYLLSFLFILHFWFHSLLTFIYFTLGLVLAKLVEAMSITLFGERFADTKLTQMRSRWNNRPGPPCPLWKSLGGTLRLMRTTTLLSIGSLLIPLRKLHSSKLRMNKLQSLWSPCILFIHHRLL